ncbi:putative porin [Bradyrhizobium sp. WSM 1738]|uniref:putative porin n=1 Tax=Bradyrhizobium hereditatis TaxID=2821405 RepID=UPI001CE28662|nr:putative porin [Bradyrhizobium hereditatis]MCA6116440.1 putative porin [Bradyrhizobium hereditatis]
MFEKKSDVRRRLMPLAVSLCALSCGAPAFGQTASDDGRASTKKSDAKRPTVLQTKPTSPSATINLVNLLVKQGVLTEEQAQALIKQADDEAYLAREAARGASVKADEAAKAANAATAATSPPGTRHVTYVPEIVKRQLREEIKREVMDKAHKENWASPGAYPEWAQRIRFYGDLRARYQGSFFPTGNDQFNAYNFNTINTGSPYDVSDISNPNPAPTYNATKDRHQARLRARLGMEADIYNGFSAGLRIATGENSSPVSTNQTLGAGGGNFSKYALWLDRGYLKYQAWNNDVAVSVGRFDNPFWSPTDLAWHRDIGFDGFAVQAKYEVAKGITPFVVAGAFPIYNTDFNIGTNFDPATGNVAKFSSRDKWLFGAQTGVATRFAPESAFRFAVAYYDFHNVQGRLSSPCFVRSASDLCDTDLTRPSFAQKGNTYRPLRDIIPEAANNFGTTNLYQYFGLVGQYRPVVASAQLDLGHFHPMHIVLDGEYIWNSAFDRKLMNAGTTINNRAGTPDGSIGPYNGGNQGWLARVTVGNKEIKQLWDWNVHAGYKYLESDATVDAFVDSDFGLGGTNLKGYFVGGNVGLSQNVWASLRWMSANNIAGVPYAVDVLQVDLNAKF